MEKKLLIVISGPSGVGKGTIVKKIVEKNNKFEVSISATTRKPRAGEVEGVNYYFKTQEEFCKMLSEDAFLESFEIFGNRYGTIKACVEERMKCGKDVILEIDVQGGLDVKKRDSSALLIFVLPPSLDELRQRLVGRNSETEESIKLRFGGAVDEIRKSKQYDYVVVNDDLNKVVDDIINIVESQRFSVALSGNKIEKFLGGELI